MWLRLKEFTDNLFPIHIWYFSTHLAKQMIAAFSIDGAM